MHVNQKQRRRHTEEFKAQVLSACAEPGTSVAGVARAFGLNDNLVHQWRRGRGARLGQATGLATVGIGTAVFVPLSLPAPPAAPSAPAAPAEMVRFEFTRGALRLNVLWPVEATAECAAWTRELLK
jgi:transposase